MMEEQTSPTAAAPMPEKNMSGSSNMDPKTIVILAWLFAPITSYLFKDESDPFVKSHVRESFYLGMANVVLLVVMFVLNIVFGVLSNLFFYNSGFLYGILTLINCLCSLIWLVVALFLGVPRLVGIIKALNMETWEVPYVTKFLSKYIKF